MADDENVVVSGEEFLGRELPGSWCWLIASKNFFTSAAPLQSPIVGKSCRLPVTRQSTSGVTLAIMVAISPLLNAAYMLWMKVMLALLMAALHGCYASDTSVFAAGCIGRRFFI
jgi:hypothetical protein